MLLIDRRAGSGEFAQWITSVPAILCELEYGDFAFLGNGKDEKDMYIGVERKTITDLQNSIKTGRLTEHQLPGLCDTFDRVYLLVEGIFKEDDDGRLVHWQGNRNWAPHPQGISAKEMRGFLFSLEEFAGVRVLYSRSTRDTCEILAQLYNWWQKPYSSHTSHMKFKIVEFPEVSIVRPNLVMKIAAQLPGLGVKKARAVHPTFKTMQEMANAPEELWKQIPGIGDTLATKLVKVIRQGEKK